MVACGSLVAIVTMVNNIINYSVIVHSPSVMVACGSLVAIVTMLNNIINYSVVVYTHHLLLWWVDYLLLQ